MATELVATDDTDDSIVSVLEVQSVRMAAPAPPRSNTDIGKASTPHAPAQPPRGGGTAVDSQVPLKPQEPGVMSPSEIAAENARFGGKRPSAYIPRPGDGEEVPLDKVFAEMAKKNGKVSVSGSPAYHRDIWQNWLKKPKDPPPAFTLAGGIRVNIEGLTRDQRETFVKLDKAQDLAIKGSTNYLNDSDTDIIREAENAVNLAYTYSLKFSVQVLKACNAFQGYSESKIKELEDEAEATEVFGPMVLFVLELVGGKLGEKIGQGLEEAGSKLANEVFEDIKQGLGDKFGKGVESKLKASSDLDDLKSGVAAMIVAANDFATHVETTVGTTIVPRLKTIINTLKSRKELSKEDQMVIHPFVGGDTDKVLEAYGVPSPSTAKAIQVGIFHGLVQKFEVQVILARARSAGGSVASGIEMRTVEQNAKRHADEAAKERGAAIDREDAAAAAKDSIGTR